MNIAKRTALGLVSAALLGACATGAEPLTVTTIALPGVNVFPESVTATATGDIIISSAGGAGIYRAAPGESVARVWLDPAASGMPVTLGVFVDDASNRLFACSRPPHGRTGPEADAASALRIFALDSGAALGRFPMPEGAREVCNDIALDESGAAYVAETAIGRIYRLAPGATSLALWAEDARFAGADGLGFDDDGSLVFNTVTTSRLFKITPNADGTAGAVMELRPSLPLARPDGLRSLGDGRFIMAESGAGRVTVFTVEGDEARMRSLGGVPGTVAATFARGRVWAVDAKFRYRSEPSLAGQDPGTFEVYSLPID